MKQFDGKKITKRMETVLSKQYPEYNFSFVKSYSWYELNVWGNGIPFTNRYYFNLGYFSDGDFSYEKFINKSSSDFFKKELDSLNNFMEINSIDDIIEEHKSIQSKVSNFNDKIACLPYEVRKQFSF
jgi:hypothetical protein